MNELVARDRSDLFTGAANAPSARSLEHFINYVKNSWHLNSDPDLVLLLRQYPELCSHRSLVVDLAVEEYKVLQREGRLSDIRQHYQSIREFGGALYSSVIRQIEVERFLENHPSIRFVDESIEWPIVGDELGKYHIIEELGQGALARVYLCLQRDLGNRQVVVKVSSAGSMEGTALGKLQHPHLMPVHSLEIHKDSGIHCLCTPFLGRSTLQDVISTVFMEGIPDSAGVILDAANIWKVSSDRYTKGPESTCRWRKTAYVDGVLYLARKLTDALIHSHAVGITHGDLKPSNILLTPAGEPVILDFNLARDKSCSESVQGGTLPYMPPEQLLRFQSATKHDATPLDERSEIFSFGVVLFELLCGKLPFEVDSSHSTDSMAEILLLQHANGPPSPVEYNPQVGQGITSILQTCLAYVPENRFASMTALQAALRQECGLMARVTRGVQLHYRALLTLLTSVVISVSAIGWWLANRPPYHERLYEMGLAYATQGQWEQAHIAFREAIETKPDSQNALYASARMSLALKNIEQARDAFIELSEHYKHAPSMAGVGYCFNLSDQHAQAIPWYERALQAGFASGGLYNNLAVSYERRKLGLTKSEQINLIQENLEKAIEYLPSSAIVHMNIVQHELNRHSINPSYNPLWGIQHVKVLLNDYSTTSEIYLSAVQLYIAKARFNSSAIDSGIEVLIKGCKSNTGIDTEELGKRAFMQHFVNHPRFAELREAALKQNAFIEQKPIPMFIDPLIDSLSIASDVSDNQLY